MVILKATILKWYWDRVYFFVFYWCSCKPACA